jgi:2-methylcitrate dehydratase
MDATIEHIVDYTCSLQFSDLPASVVHDCKRRLIDTVGCAIAGFDSEPAAIARRLALGVGMDGGARVFGTHHRTSPELATFANGVMVRFLDGNDFFPDASGGGHPSDVIPALLAAAELARSDGQSIIAATVLAYEIFHSLLRSVSMRARGLDHVYYTAVASAAGGGKLLGLSREQMMHALALAATPNVPLGVTRRGRLSMWKGCAAAHAARNGIFAALLAGEGMTGPDKPIAGAHGLHELVGKFDLRSLGANDRFHILDANLKYRLAVGHSQAPITAALQFNTRFGIEEIDKVTVYTYWASWSEIGSEPEKWHPTSRETADHSLPYIVAAILIDGAFSDQIFSDERLRDGRIHRLTDKISVIDDAEFSRQFPEKIPCRIELQMRNGERRTATVEYPRGDTRNPMTDGEVDEKFRDLAQRALTKRQTDSVLNLLWRFETLTDVDSVYADLVIKGEKH